MTVQTVLSLLEVARLRRGAFHGGLSVSLDRAHFDAGREDRRPRGCAPGRAPRGFLRRPTGRATTPHAGEPERLRSSRARRRLGTGALRDVSHQDAVTVSSFCGDGTRIEGSLGDRSPRLRAGLRGRRPHHKRGRTPRSGVSRGAWVNQSPIVGSPHPRSIRMRVPPGRTGEAGHATPLCRNRRVGRPGHQRSTQSPRLTGHCQLQLSRSCGPDAPQSRRQRWGTRLRRRIIRRRGRERQTSAVSEGRPR